MRTGLAEGPGEVPRVSKLTVRPLSDLDIYHEPRSGAPRSEASAVLPFTRFWRAIAVPLHGLLTSAIGADAGAHCG